jgi:DNA replication protein DnaC
VRDGRDYFRDLAAKAEALKAWEAENQELAAAWNEAREFDKARMDAAAWWSERAAAWEALVADMPRRLHSMGAPQRAIDAWVAGPTETKALTAVRSMHRLDRTFALLTGDTGVGKTVAAVCGMALRLMDARREELPCLLVRAVEGARLGLYDAEDKKLARQMHVAGLLVLDDLGAEFMSEGGVWRSVLDEVIDARYGDMMPTIITTNLDTPQFRARYGERIADRIRHAGVIEACGTGSMRERGKG